MAIGQQVQILDGGTPLSVDLVLSEDYSYPSDITQYPVESGSTMSDHILNKAFTITVQPFVTQNPIYISNGEDKTTAAAQAVWAQAVQNAYKTLKALRAARQLVTLITGLDRFPNMALADLRFNRDRKTTNVLIFTAKFQEFNITNSQTIQMPNMRSGKIADKANVSDAGKQTPQTVQPPSTIALSLTNAVRDMLGQPALKGGIK